MSVAPAWSRFAPVVALLIAVVGCERRPAGDPPAGLEPAYTRDKILDPALETAARAFIAWAGSQAAGDKPVFGPVDILPPAPTLLPYGIGTYQKETRLPAVMITGPGWPSLSREEREAMAAKAFDELSRLLPKSSLRPTVTIQTPQGLELAWINETQPGRTLLHGEVE